MDQMDIVFSTRCENVNSLDGHGHSLRVGYVAHAVEARSVLMHVVALALDATKSSTHCFLVVCVSDHAHSFAAISTVLSIPL